MSACTLTDAEVVLCIACALGDGTCRAEDVDSFVRWLGLTQQARAASLLKKTLLLWQRGSLDCLDLQRFIGDMTGWNEVRVGAAMADAVAAGWLTPKLS